MIIAPPHNASSTAVVGMMLYPIAHFWNTARIIYYLTAPFVSIAIAIITSMIATAIFKIAADTTTIQLTIIIIIMLLLLLLLFQLFRSSTTTFHEKIINTHATLKATWIL